MSEYLELFGIAWLTLIIAAIPLSLLGILVVARNQVILAIAASQSAACGAALAMLLIGALGGGHIHGDLRIHLGAMLGGLIGTAIAWTGTHERAAWLFAAAGAGTILFISHSPYGMHDVLALQHSNAMIATTRDVVLFALITITLLFFLKRWNTELRLLAIDPIHAHSCGMDVSRWNLVLGAIIGLVLSLAVSVFGLLYAFACLILPSLIGGSLIKSFKSLLWLAPVISIGATILGIVLGHTFDIAPGQSITALLAFVYPLACVIGWQPSDSKTSLDQAERSG